VKIRNLRAETVKNINMGRKGIREQTIENKRKKERKI
jgi:hypothetical protein